MQTAFNFSFHLPKRRSWTAALTAATVLACSAATASNAPPHAALGAGIQTTPQDVAPGTAVLYYNDYNIATDSFGEALGNLGIVPTFTDTPETFETLLQSGNWDLVIAIHQDSSGGSGVFVDELADYVAGGGRAIGIDWTGTLAPVFRASASGNENLTTITPSAHPIWDGIAGPVAISTTGWGVFSLGLVSNGDGHVEGSFENGNGAIVIGNGDRTIFNGPLQDTYDSESAGTRLAENEIAFLLDAVISCDANNNGIYDVQDPRAFALQCESTASASCDLNHDGGYTRADVRAFQQQCRVPPRHASPRTATRN
jgi:hypothetical protein